MVGFAIVRGLRVIPLFALATAPAVSKPAVETSPVEALPSVASFAHPARSKDLAGNIAKLDGPGEILGLLICRMR
jgi:hypothetical protein